MADITSESVADIKSECLADLPRITHFVTPDFSSWEASAAGV
jgi:hypothetical protein